MKRLKVVVNGVVIEEEKKPKRMPPMLNGDEVRKLKQMTPREIQLHENQTFQQAPMGVKKLMAVMNRVRRRRNLKYILDPDPDE